MHMHTYARGHTHTRTNILFQAELPLYIFQLSLAKFLGVTVSIIEQCPCKNFTLQSVSEVNQRVTVQKLTYALPGGQGQPMLSVTVKTIARRGVVCLFLPCEKMFLPAEVNAFMASIY